MSAMRPTASSLLLKCRWSTAPRRHNQPEMVASGVINKKHTMSPKRVRFSCWGPGFLNHCRKMQTTQMSAKGGCFSQDELRAYRTQTCPFTDLSLTTCSTWLWLSPESFHVNLSPSLPTRHLYLPHHLFSCSKSCLEKKSCIQAAEPLEKLPS